MFNYLVRFFKRFYSDRKPDGLQKYEQEKLVHLQKKMNMSFSSNEYYIKALTHRSFLEISTDFKKSNERLEFLGDAVLGLIVAETLFKKFPDKHEGYLTKYRSQLVDREALYKAAERLDLMKYILYDKRYVRESDQGKKTIIADCLEALIGAVYLDKGIKGAKDFVFKWIIVPNFKSGHVKVDKNYKGRLLEFTHSRKMESPKYKVVSEEGPDHNKKFEIEVFIGSESYGIGIGKNKKAAEQEAAKEAIAKLMS